MVHSFAWCDTALEVLDQRALPHEEIRERCEDFESVREAIVSMRVRGAPAIGIVGAYGLALAAMHASDVDWRRTLEQAIDRMEQARPTAVNLSWAMAGLRGVIAQATSLDKAQQAILEFAKAIHEDDRKRCDSMAHYGADWIKANSVARPLRVMTHCNTGALATGGVGTAIGVIGRLADEGRIEKVIATETRPWLQGARLTAWELKTLGLPVELIVDSAAAHTMSQGVDWLIVGADRITGQGDVANKIGTLQLAVLARHFGVKVMVVAPLSSFDLSMRRGQSIEIEQRPATEVTHWNNKAVAADGVSVSNPVFDVTPHWLVDVIVHEKAVISGPNWASLGGIQESLL